MKMKKIRKSAFLTPILNVSDLQRSFDYYENVLRFEKRWEWGEPADYGCVIFGDVEIFLCLNGQGQPGNWIYLFIDGVDDYFEKVSSRGADIVRGIQDEPWGMREFHLRDPDGHILRVGTGLDRIIEE